MNKTEHDRHQRSTQFEMHCRQSHVIEQLQDGPKSINELFSKTDWSYSQAIITLRKMREDNEIVQVGKNGREVIYGLQENIDLQENADLAKVYEHIGDPATIIGLHCVASDGCKIDLRFPNGDTLKALLIA
jgi:ribosomal protein S25